MSLFTTIKTICKGILSFSTIFVRVVLRPTFETMPALILLAFLKQMLSGSTFQTFLLMPFFIFDLFEETFLLGHLLLYPPLLLILHFLQLHHRINNQLFGIFKSLGQFSQLSVYPSSFSFIALNIRIYFLLLKFFYLILNTFHR